MRKVVVMVAFIACCMVAACSYKINITPLSVNSQIIFSINPNFSMGNFTYLPARNGFVKLNEIKNHGNDYIYLSENIDDLCKKITQEGLISSNAVIKKQSEFAISGDIVELTMNSWGFNGVSFLYTVIYKIANANGDEVYMNSFNKIKTGVHLWSMSKLSEVVQEMMLDAYNELARDIEEKNIFDRE